MKTTVQGYEFEITEPYAEGHKINAIEAKALNQLRAENIGNNQRKVVQKVVEDQPMVPDPENEGQEIRSPLSDEQVKDLQGKVSAYDAEYVLSMTRGGARRDPVEQMARTIAKTLLEKEAKANGHGTLKAWREKVGDAAYNEKMEELAANKKVQAAAKRNVELEL